MAVALAKRVRDLLLDMRTKLLAHVDAEAVRVAADGAAYRVAGDDVPSEEAAPERAAKA